MKKALTRLPDKGVNMRAVMKIEPKEKNKILPIIKNK